MYPIQTSITVNWRARDFESGIYSMFISISDNKNQTISDWRRFAGDLNSAFIDNIYLAPSSNGTLYHVVLKAQNKAGLTSEQTSKPIYIQKANVPGEKHCSTSLM